jgi:hypothetical protein
MFTEQAKELAKDLNVLAIETALINAFYDGKKDGIKETGDLIDAQIARITAGDPSKKEAK